MKKLTTMKHAIAEARKKMQNTLLDVMSKTDYLTAKEIGENCEADARTVAGIIQSCLETKQFSIFYGPKKTTVTKYAKLNEDGSVDFSKTIRISRRVNTYRKNIDRI